MGLSVTREAAGMPERFPNCPVSRDHAERALAVGRPPTDGRRGGF